MYLKRLGQWGFSLPEILIALAIMGGITLGVMKLLQQQSENQSALQVRAEINKTISIIQTTLSDGKHCMAALGGMETTASLTDLRYSFDKNGTPTSRILLLRDIPYQYFMIKGSDPDALSLKPKGDSMVELVIKFTIKKADQKESWAESKLELIKTIPLYVTLEGTKILSCESTMLDSNLLAMEKMCDSLSNLDKMAIWDVMNSRCVLKEMSCGFGTVPVQLNSLGEMICSPIEVQYKPEEIFDFSGVNCTGKTTYEIGLSGGKLKVLCP